jgi:predicted glycoside hydrolase/deacetylase ChbG (UPF0249 family)
MANGDAFDDAVRLARETPTLDIGCHLVLIGGRSLLTGEAFPATAPQLVAALAMGRIRVYDELAAQLRRIADTGKRPTHLDTHKHTHLAPPVLDAVARGRRVRRAMGAAALDFHTRSAKACRDERLTSDALADAALPPRPGEAGCRTTDHFAGFRLPVSHAGTDRVMSVIPQGSRVMVHPGRCGPVSRGARD